MADTSAILNAGTLASAFIGAVIGVFVDRLLRRLESIPLFRLQLGYFKTLDSGNGWFLSIENVGLDPVPEYQVWLHHPDRGSIEVFNGDPQKLAFPQYPQQKNEFRCVTQPKPGTGHLQEYLRTWLHTVRGKQVAAPHFAKFTLRLVLKNSEQILFEDGGLGNNIAKLIFEDLTGQKTEQPIEDIFYRSKAPFWVEMIRNYRIRRMIRRVDKEIAGQE